MADKKSKHTGLWLACICFLLLSILFFTLSNSVSGELPRALEYRRSRTAKDITFTTYERMPQVSFTDNLALCAEPGTETVEKIGEVMPALVNEHYFDVYDIHVGGSAVTEAHVANKTRAVVISDKAAQKMSLDGNVVGQTLSLWGKDFTVVGVYQKPKGILREISSDIYERVYVPFTCFDGYRELAVDTVAAKKDSYSEKALPLLGMNNPATGYFENDINVKHDMIAGFPNLLMTFIGVVIAVAVIRIIFGMGKSAANRLRTARQNEYMPAVLKKNRLYLLSRVLLAAALAAVPVAIFFLFPPRLVIPQSYIPYDNIFELNHYLDAFTAHMQQENTNLAVGNGYYRHLFDNTMLVLLPVLLILTVLTLVIARAIRKLVKKRKLN